MTGQRMNPPSVDEGSERPHVLVVDDDQELLVSLERGLSLCGFDVGLARDSGEALVYLRGRRPAVVVLDIMMPGMDGLSLCQVIRETEAIPIIMLTALDSVRDRISGIKAGADDYLVKPFVFDELVVRIQALLRRSSPTPPSKERLSYADLTLDPATWTAKRGEKNLPLTATEFRLLQQFLRTPEQVQTRNDLLLGLWGEDPSVEDHVVDVHVANLRQKLEAAGGPPLIQTIRGVGYILKEA